MLGEGICIVGLPSRVKRFGLFGTSRRPDATSTPVVESAKRSKHSGLRLPGTCTVVLPNIRDGCCLLRALGGMFTYTEVEQDSFRREAVVQGHR